MKQIALWKTKDGKHWLKLFDESHGPSWCYRIEGSHDTENLGKILLLDALEYVEGILSRWPSKPIRHH